MEAGCENGNGAPVAIERGMVDELVVEGDVDGFRDLEVVVSFENLLPAVGQGSVASEDAEATSGEEVLVWTLERPLRAPARPMVLGMVTFVRRWNPNAESPMAVTGRPLIVSGITSAPSGPTYPQIVISVPSLLVAQVNWAGTATGMAKSSQACISDRLFSFFCTSLASGTSILHRLLSFVFRALADKGILPTGVVESLQQAVEPLPVAFRILGLIIRYCVSGLAHRYPRRDFKKEAAKIRLDIWRGMEG